MSQDHQYHHYFMTGIHTGVGKTLVSALMVEHYHYDYWKPFQTGEDTDTKRVRSLVSAEVSQNMTFHEELFKGIHPVSPHLAQRIQGTHWSLDSITLPHSPLKRGLVVEGAGGVFSPLGSYFENIDLMKRLNELLDGHLKIILVVRPYLGAINHTLMSLELLHHGDFHSLGIFINGEEDLFLEEYVSKRTNVPIMGKLAFQSHLHPLTIQTLSKSCWIKEREQLCR